MRARFGARGRSLSLLPAGRPGSGRLGRM